MFIHLSVILYTGGSLYDVSSCLAAWYHVPSGGVSVPSPMFLLDGVSVRGRCPPLDRGSLDRDPPSRRPAKLVVPILHVDVLIKVEQLST